MSRATPWCRRSSPPTNVTRISRAPAIYWKKSNRRKHEQALGSASLGQRLQGNLRLNGLPVTQHRNSDGIADLVFFQQEKQIVGCGNFLAVDGNDDIAQAQPSFGVAPSGLNSCSGRRATL